MTYLDKFIEDWTVDSRIEHAQTLHPECFRHPEILRAELRCVFTQRWLMLSPVYSHKGTTLLTRTMLQNYGGRIPFTSHGRPVYLEYEQHNEHEQIKAFSNVCTHAWYPLVKGHNRKKSIQCQQHGRAFESQGKCVGQPGFNDVSDFPASTDDLSEFPLQWWNQLPLISFGEPTVDVQSIFSAIDESICGINMEELRYHPQEEEVREINGNWKLHAWNFLDNFHIPYIHGGRDSLTTAMEYHSYQTEIHDNAVLQWVYARNPEHGFHHHQISSRFRHPEQPEKRVLALWWFIFPNMALNFYPWGLSINIYEPHPTVPDKTVFRWYHFVQDHEKYEQRDPIWMNQKVDDEDVEALNLVRNNLHSPECRRGRFAPTRERASHWFHHRVSKLLESSTI